MSEFYQEHYGENIFLISIFLNKIGPIISEFFININSLIGSTRHQGILCVTEFQNSGISSFGRDADTPFVLTEIVKNSKWPQLFSFSILRQIL